MRQAAGAALCRPQAEGRFSGGAIATDEHSVQHHPKEAKSTNRTLLSRALSPRVGYGRFCSP